MKRAAQMAELVDAHGSGPCAARRGGSSPLLGTNSRYPDVDDVVESQKNPLRRVFSCLALTTKRIHGVQAILAG